MTKLPRDMSGSELAQALRVFSYAETRQSGSHLRLTSLENGEHHLTIPLHISLRVGTLNAIIGEVAAHFKLSREEVLRRIL
jgi:predicted RNA binding protein YcfA (HicA-like mRNA interferase family)